MVSFSRRYFVEVIINELFTQFAILVFYWIKYLYNDTFWIIIYTFITTLIPWTHILLPLNEWIHIHIMLYFSHKLFLIIDFCILYLFFGDDALRTETYITRSKIIYIIFRWVTESLFLRKNYYSQLSRALEANFGCFGSCGEFIALPINKDGSAHSMNFTLSARAAWRLSSAAYFFSCWLSKCFQ